jgi:hypothetical protein
MSVFSEIKVTLRHDGQIVNFGTADVIAVTDEKIAIIDFKFGRKVREDALTLQIANYAAAAVSSFLPVREKSHLPIEAWAFFPRLNQRFVWRCETGEAAINEVAPQVRAIIEAAENAAPEDATPGAHCDYCRHLPNCAAVREAGQRELVKFNGDLLPDRAVELYDLGLVVEKQVKAVRVRIREMLLANPDAIPGLQLREKGGRRQVKDGKELRKRLYESGKLNAVDWLKATEPSPAALERVYLAKYYQGKGKGLPTQTELKAELAEIAGDTVKQTKNKVLVRT